jgi:tetratricopeptide (TPR) repeat protein
LSGTIESPDFTTAEEAINRLLDGYGATAQDMEKSTAEKKKLLFDFLNELPAFIVADDIDTLLEDVDVVSLFTHEIPQTASAVLLTSRRAIPGIRNYVVQGFNAAEAEKFIKSRIQLYGLKLDPFSPSVISDIRNATDGSPLYMDDLLRLTGIVDIKSAIRMWNEKTGDEARKYALQRELEQISPDGRRVLIAAAVTDDPVSFAELENVLEFSEERLLSALNELHALFLLPRTPVVEGEQRFQINLNTKKLVRLVEGQTTQYSRIESVSKALAGKLPSVGHTIVSPLIRQAHLRLNADQIADAEAILLKAIEKYPNAADLRGFLGYVYKRIGRTADARSQFEAAYKLKSKNPDMFLHWIKMESAEKNWLKAIDIADRAIKVIPDPYEIVERKVSALRQAGFDLYGGLHREKATKMWSEAVEEIKLRIRPPEQLATGKRQLNASMYFSMVVCLDMLNRLNERNHWLEVWEKEHPDDPKVAQQREFIILKRGSL